MRLSPILSSPDPDAGGVRSTDEFVTISRAELDELRARATGLGRRRADFRRENSCENAQSPGSGPLSGDCRPGSQGGRARAGLQGGPPRPGAGDGPGRQAPGPRGRGATDQALARRLRGRRRGWRDPRPRQGRPRGRPGRRSTGSTARTSPTSASPRREGRDGGQGAEPLGLEPGLRRRRAPTTLGEAVLLKWRESAVAAASPPVCPAGGAVVADDRPGPSLAHPFSPVPHVLIPGSAIGRLRPGVSILLDRLTISSGVRFHVEQLSARDSGRVRQPGRDRQRHLCRHVELVRQSLPHRHADAPGPGRLDHVLDREPTDFRNPGSPRSARPSPRPTPRSPWSTPARS